MLRTSTSTELPQGEGITEVPQQLSHQELVEERLDLIVHYLHTADRRERLRTITGTIRSVISIVPFILFLGSLWYVYAHGQDLMTQITAEAAKQAAVYSQNSMSGFVDHLKSYIPGGSHSSASSR